MANRIRLFGDDGVAVLFDCTAQNPQQLERLWHSGMGEHFIGLLKEAICANMAKTAIGRVDIKLVLV